MSGEVNSENYIVIQGWMINELDIKGNELIVYAIIYGFSQIEGQVFNGSLQYLANWTKSTKQGVTKNLKSLVEKGYIVKKDKYINGVKFCEYYATKFKGVCNKVEQGIQQSLIPPMQQSLTNNISLDNTNNINNNKKEIKKEYLSPLGEFENILLTKEELNKLKDKIPNYQDKIDDLSIYLENNPKKKYASHYATILTWYRKEQKEKAEKPKTNASNSYKRQEIVPDWMNKETKSELMNPKELKELEEEFKQFKTPEEQRLPQQTIDFETRRAALQEKLKRKYAK